MITDNLSMTSHIVTVHIYNSMSLYIRKALTSEMTNLLMTTLILIIISTTDFQCWPPINISKWIQRLIKSTSKLICDVKNIKHR